MPNSHLRKAKILIVDDQDSKRLALASALEVLGQEIVMVSSGREALRAILRDDFAVILLDVRMPGMDGFETAGLIRSRQQTESTPIIFVTAHDRAESDMLGGYHLGAVDFIFAPIQADVLRAKVSVFVELHRKTMTVQAHERRLRQLEARQAQHELQKLSSAIEQSADPVVITNRDGLIEYVNAAFEQVTGYPPEEAIGQSIALLESGEHPTEYHDQMWDTIRQGKVYRGEFISRRKDGSLYHEEKTITPIRDADGLITHYVSTGKDVTERRRMEEELRVLNASLEQRVRERTAQLEDVNHELEAYAYSISHDLRTPLRHIGSFVDLLGRNHQDDLPETARRYLKIIRDGAGQMEALIDGLLDFARTGRHEMRVQTVNLSVLLREVIHDLDQHHAGAGVQWTVQPLPEVCGDLISLRQVFMNLLSNAVKYSHGQSDPQVEIWATDDDQQVVIHVRDNGVGFNMAYYDKMFRVFQRLHNSVDFEGHGVGLAHVRRIVLRHGGRVWAESQEGQGATFSVALPRKVSAAPPLTLSDPPEHSENTQHV
ncbi:sensor histidine kinase [Deinococcus fonticola]|uniref:sensor histidine kinase n=1 Tax=Deinococcus fonticola TaxID=2528713 RepID=UPI001074F5DA|nr:ATP-binding protein [Deinococcus fonticola]